MGTASAGRPAPSRSHTPSSAAVSTPISDPDSLAACCSMAIIYTGGVPSPRLASPNPARPPAPPRPAPRAAGGRSGGGGGAARLGGGHHSGDGGAHRGAPLLLRLRPLLPHQVRGSGHGAAQHSPVQRSRVQRSAAQRSAASCVGWPQLRALCGACTGCRQLERNGARGARSWAAGQPGHVAARGRRGSSRVLRTALPGRQGAGTGRRCGRALKRCAALRCAPPPCRYYILRNNVVEKVRSAPPACLLACVYSLFLSMDHAHLLRANCQCLRQAAAAAHRLSAGRLLAREPERSEHAASLRR